MKIPIGRFLDWYEPIGDWLNVVLFWRVRRIDIAIAILGLGCVSYYWIVTGWLGALMGGLLFLFVAMIGLWIL